MQSTEGGWGGHHHHTVICGGKIGGKGRTRCEKKSEMRLNDSLKRGERRCKSNEERKERFSLLND